MIQRDRRNEPQPPRVLAARQRNPSRCENGARQKAWVGVEVLAKFIGIDMGLIIPSVARGHQWLKYSHLIFFALVGCRLPVGRFTFPYSTLRPRLKPRSSYAAEGDFTACDDSGSSFRMPNGDKSI